MTSYVLITSARNEEEYIEQTLQSVTSQTVLPRRWVIVDDGSTDGTAACVKKYADRFDWIELISTKPGERRNFAAKARNVAMAYDRLRNLTFDVVGNIDADISFAENHMAFLLDKLSEDQQLGLAGTAYLEKDFDSRKNTTADTSHVSGQCQLFRRECWEAIGGYSHSSSGGIDWLAVRTARMKGWKVTSFHERTFFHHKPMGTGGGNIWKAWFRNGQKDYRFGNHPVWELFRVVFQMRGRPYVIGGLVMLAGFLWAAIRHVERIAPADVMAFHRAEQLGKLRTLLGLKVTTREARSPRSS